MVEYNKKILIADDEPNIRETLREFVVEILGYKVELAENGSQALTLLKESPNDYGVILTDLKMPILDGLELIKNGKLIDSDYVFVIITGYATKDNAISALKRGAYDFIHKPFNLTELSAVLNRAIENWTLREENRNYQLNLEKLVKKRTEEIESLNFDLKELLKLNDDINKISEFEQRIQEFRNGLLKKFSPDTAVMVLYDNFNKEFRSPWLYTQENANIQFPSTTNLLLREKSFYCDDSIKNHEMIERLKLNPDDKVFFFNRFEYEVFLGYLYLGFKEKIDYSDFKNRLDLFSSTLESILFNNYLVQVHQREKEKMFLSGIKVIADTVEANSPFTRKHSDRVEKVARFLAERLGFPYERKYTLSVACILHDIGKVGIDSRIVYKPGTLTPAERKIMEKHPELGSKIVKNLYGFKIDHFIRHHHERWDGGGYPDGLKSEEIPFESRIIALADAFDSMITDRPYRTGLPLNDVIEEIKRCAGTQFDPDLAAVFLETLTDNIANFKLQILSEAG